ncbi:MAG TPA: DUF4268 domain-containing protein [Cytophagaceae bacterium]|jgi:hypothetical protein
MFTKEEASRIRQEFWTVFGQYMSPVPFAEEGKKSWVNYKTGVKNIYFRMDADHTKGYIGIEITHGDLEMQQLVFEQLLELENQLKSFTGEAWSKKLHLTDESGKVISRLYKELKPANVFLREMWPDLISFFKIRIVALDQFWSEFRYGFEE